MIYWISLYLLRFVTRIYFRGQVFGKNNLPTSGSYIGVVNHNSNLDTFAMSLAVNKPVHTMVKESLFRVPLLKWWLGKVHMFPVKRNASDQQAFDNALNILQNGGILFMAPEGTRKRKSNNRHRPRTGFVRLAQLVGCPVVPIAIWGTDRALPPHSFFPRPFKIIVKIGKPIILPKTQINLEAKDSLQKQANSVMENVYQLIAEIETYTQIPRE